MFFLFIIKKERFFRIILMGLVFAVVHCLSKPPFVVPGPKALPTCEEVQKAQDTQWLQNIEMVSFCSPKEPPTVLNSIEPYDYYKSHFSCDDDPDKDYVIVFKFKEDINPYQLKWTASSWPVHAAFSVTYNSGTLRGFGHDHREARLCIGENGVSFAGGIENVMDNIKLVDSGILICRMDTP